MILYLSCFACYVFKFQVKDYRYDDLDKWWNHTHIALWIEYCAWLAELREKIDLE